MPQMSGYGNNHGNKRLVHCSVLGLDEEGPDVIVDAAILLPSEWLLLDCLSGLCLLMAPA
eukprot:m.510297 g.510297  ORF g.510297 m.510297 type:complete len:60 (-) comp57414_c0_seq1:29-208(-)